MTASLPSLIGIPLFRDLNDTTLSETLALLNYKVVTLEKGRILFRAGEAADRFAVVLGGAVNVIRYEEDGRETIVEQATRGELIGAAYVAAGLPAYLQNAIAAEDSFALVLNGRSLMDVTRGGALERVRLRLLGMMARKNLMLQRKLACLSQKKTADKLLTFLRMTQQTAGTESFEIPYTREQLAAYLNVARPALSAEISRLVREGILETSRKTFRLKRT